MTTHPFGFWPSPLSIEEAASLKVSASALRSLGADLYWIEGRPDRAGQRVVMRWPAHGAAEITSPLGLSLSSRVHEYGGGAMTVMDYDGPLVVGVRSQDQAIVSFRPGDDAETLVVAVENASFGDLTPIAGQSALLATQETHSESGDVVRSIVRIDLDDHSVASLVTGRDFLAGGRSAPDGRQVAWCAWDHPSMPWDGSEVWSGFLSHAEGRWEIVDAVHVAGGVGNPACHPTFADDGALLFVFEADEWGIPWSREPAKGPKALLDDEADYGAPLWELGETELVGRRGRRWGLRRSGGLVSPVEIVSGSFVPWESSATLVNSIIPTDAGLAWIGSTSDRLAVVVRANDDGVEVARVELGGVPPLRPDEIARPETITVEGRDGGAVHGLLFPPVGIPADSESGPPPVVVFCHGGPTAQARAGFDPVIQTFTSRGFAVLAVNYAGSTGYGATYRRRLDGRWGVADVEDCVDIVTRLGETGRVDPTRAAIRGGSAGGFTALLGLTTDLFTAAVSWYGVADLLTLVESTHDFESRYLDSLVGPLPEARQRYIDRSPVTQAPTMSGAALLLQGLDDPVVPAEQARAMARALRENGHDVELIEFEGESHGFRRADTLVAALEAELAFYRRHLCHESPTGHR